MSVSGIILRHLAPSSVLAAVFLVLMSTVVNSQTDQLEYCGTKPCIEPVRMSCEEMMERYRFQGSCCSMENIPQTGGCRVTVSFGNCFWYPWCGDCPASEEVASRCNKVFSTDANQSPCPAGDFDPLEIQASVNFTTPSCSPTMSPSTMVDDGNDGSSSASSLLSANVVITGAVGLLVAAVAAAFVAA